MPPETRTELLELRLVPPPGSSASISDRDALAGIGSEIATSFRVAPFLPFRACWIAVITEFEWNHHFADVQKKGPFKSFHQPRTSGRNKKWGKRYHRARCNRVRRGVRLARRAGAKILRQTPVKANVCLSANDAREAVETSSGHVGKSLRPVRAEQGSAGLGFLKLSSDVDLDSK